MYFSQKDPRWAKQKLGTCKETFSQVGCFNVSFCNFLKKLEIAKIRPDEFNKKAYPHGGCMADASYWASLFDLNYKKVPKLTGLKYPEVVIAETDHYKKYGVPQHFFLYRPKDKKRIDPLDIEPSWEDNNYNIVSYRIFTPKSSSGITPKGDGKVIINIPNPINTGPKVEILPEVKNDPIPNDSTLSPNPVQPSTTANVIEKAVSGDAWIDVSPAQEHKQKPLFQAIIEFIKGILSK